MLRVLAIDPGTSHTGLALVDEYGINCAQTIHGRGGSLGTDNALIIERCEQIADEVERLCISWPHDVVVIEGYEPFVHQGRVNAQAATQTPILVGAICDRLRHENLHPQYSSVVLRQSGGVYGLYGIRAKGMDAKLARVKLMEKVAGGTKCRTDHERAAAAHALWYLAEEARLFDI